MLYSCHTKDRQRSHHTQRGRALRARTHHTQTFGKSSIHTTHTISISILYLPEKLKTRRYPSQVSDINLYLYLTSRYADMDRYVNYNNQQLSSNHDGNGNADNTNSTSPNWIKLAADTTTWHSLEAHFIEFTTTTTITTITNSTTTNN